MLYKIEVNYHKKSNAYYKRNFKILALIRYSIGKSVFPKNRALESIKFSLASHEAKVMSLFYCIIHLLWNSFIILIRFADTFACHYKENLIKFSIPYKKYSKYSGIFKHNIAIKIYEEMEWLFIGWLLCYGCGQYLLMLAIRELEIDFQQIFEKVSISLMSKINFLRRISFFIFLRQPF